MYNLLPCRQIVNNNDNNNNNNNNKIQSQQ